MIFTKYYYPNYHRFISEVLFAWIFRRGKRRKRRKKGGGNGNEYIDRIKWEGIMKRGGRLTGRAVNQTD